MFQTDEESAIKTDIFKSFSSNWKTGPQHMHLQESRKMNGVKNSGFDLFLNV